MASTLSNKVLSEVILPSEGSALMIKRAALVVLGIAGVAIAAQIPLPFWPGPVPTPCSRVPPGVRALFAFRHKPSGLTFHPPDEPVVSEREPGRGLTRIRSGQCRVVCVAAVSGEKQPTPPPGRV